MTYGIEDFHRDLARIPRFTETQIRDMLASYEDHLRELGEPPIVVGIPGPSSPTRLVHAGTLLPTERWCIGVDHGCKPSKSSAMLVTRNPDGLDRYKLAEAYPHSYERPKVQVAGVVVGLALRGFERETPC